MAIVAVPGGNALTNRDMISVPTTINVQIGQFRVPLGIACS